MFTDVRLFYILANKRVGTLYCGVTNDLIQRIAQHKIGEGGDFTKKYKIDKLVYYETAENIADAIHREKCIKEWKRDWKLKLIDEFNPDWKDLYNDILLQ